MHLLPFIAQYLSLGDIFINVGQSGSSWRCSEIGSRGHGKWNWFAARITVLGAMWRFLS